MSIWNPVTRPRHDAARKLTLLLALPALLLGLLLWQGKSGAAAPSDVQWSSPQHISSGTNAAFGPELRAASNGQLMVAYNRRRSDSEDQNPYYSLSNDGGATWSAPAAIHTANENLRQVTLAFDSNNTAHAVWRTETGLAHAAEPQWPSGSHIVFSSPDVILEPSLAIGGDDVLHLVWAQSSGGPVDVYHAYSTDDGANWSTPTILSTTSNQHSRAPIAAVDADNHVHVVWEEGIPDHPSPDILFRYEVQYRKGTKDGSNFSWSSVDVVSGSLLQAQRPSLIADGNNLHVSFAQEVDDPNSLQPRQYPYHTSFEPGSGWSTVMDVSGNNPVRVNTNDPFFLITTLAACGNSVHLNYHGAQQEEPNAKEQIWGTRMTSGNNWAPVTAVTGSDTRNINPSVACGGGNVHLAFERVEQATVNHQIYYATEHNTNGAFLPVMLKQ